VAGELWVRGGRITRGYLDDPAATAETIDADGWLHTGDLAEMDGDGACRVVGRLKDMIKTGGENVSPVEVEELLVTHPDVDRAAVVGLPDERWGKIVAAFIQRRSPVTQQELDEHCRASGLANFKRPRKVVFVSAIPKSPVGKLLRRQLVAGEYQAEEA
jgi:fatty-acyl-CoA synthase